MQTLRERTSAVMAAFIADARGKKVSVSAVEASINDANRLNELLGLDGGDLAETTEAIRDSLKSGGELVGKFNVNAEAATAFVASRSAELVTQVSEEAREAIRAIVGAGRTLGESPNTIALDLVGRIGRSGRREGGVIGLNGPQGEAVANALKNLRSGDPELMNKYLQNKRRDRRYDGVVKRAMEAGKPVPKKDLHNIIRRYEARLLQTRGETVGRTEAMEAVNAGKQQSIQQQIESGALGEGKTAVKKWLTNVDGDTRQDHIDMNGETVPVDEPFVLPDGSRMMHPGDSSLGAAAGEIINCRCSVSYEVVDA